MLATQHTHIQQTHAKLFTIALGGKGGGEEPSCTGSYNKSHFFVPFCN